MHSGVPAVLPHAQHARREQRVDIVCRGRSPTSVIACALWRDGTVWTDGVESFEFPRGSTTCCVDRHASVRQIRSGACTGHNTKVGAPCGRRVPQALGKRLCLRGDSLLRKQHAGVLFLGCSAIKKGLPPEKAL